MNDLVLRLKHDLQERYAQKYGRVLVNFDEVLLEKETEARVRFTICDNEGYFITRYYGHAGYKGNHLYVRTMAI